MTNIERYNESVRRMADGYSADFAEFCAGDERIHDVMMQLSSEFVETNVPILSEESHVDLALELLMSITVQTV